MSEDQPRKKKRGPKGGIKHTPGRGHMGKSGPAKKRRFERKAARKRREAVVDLARQWAEWDALPAEVQKLLLEKKPTSPRPTNGH